MNILLTGASSFLGRAVTVEAIEEGYEVYALVRPDSKHAAMMPTSKHLHMVSEDMHHVDNWREDSIPDVDICIHLSWSGEGVLGRSDANLQDINIDDTLKLMELVSRHGCKRWIMAGSQAEYGITLEKMISGEYDGAPIDEYHTCHPISEYGKAKLKVLIEGSKLCERLDMTYIHARIFSVYGPGDHDTSLVASVIGGLSDGKDITLGPCRQMWNYIYVSDCAKALCNLAACTITETALEREPEECVVNIASEDSRVLREYAEQIAKTIGSDAQIYFEDRATGIEGTPYLYPDISKLQRLTGYKSKVEFGEGIRQIISERTR